MIKLTIENFEEKIEKVVDFIKKNPPSTNKEFMKYTKNFYGVELTCKCTVYKSGVSYEVQELEKEYSQVPLYKKWEKKFSQYDGLKVLLNATFGRLTCGGVASRHYGQTELTDINRLEKLKNWDGIDNSIKVIEAYKEQQKQLQEIFGVPINWN